MYNVDDELRKCDINICGNMAPTSVYILPLCVLSLVIYSQQDTDHEMNEDCDVTADKLDQIADVMTSIMGRLDKVGSIIWLYSDEEIKIH